MLDPLRTEVLAWIDAERCMARALGFVVTWFAEDDEEVAFKRSIAYPMAVLNTFESWAKGSAEPGARPKEELVRFAGFSEATARVMSPLLETVLIHQPSFLSLAEETGESEAVRFYGLFHGAWATYLCHPVWKMVPSLAPPGWNTAA